MDKEHCCCPPNSLPKYDFESANKGTVSKIGDVDVYIVGDSPKVFIFCYDIFGFTGGRTRQVCDQISSFGFTVVLADILKGDIWAEAKPFGPELYQWLSTLKYEPIEEYLLKTLIPYLQNNGKKEFAVGGTCFGAWVGLKLLAASDLVKCGISYHPSYKLEELQGRKIEDIATKVKQPHLIVPAGNDPDNVKNGGEIVKILEQTTGNKLQVVEMNDMQHGFFVRGDLKDEAILKRVEECLTLTKDFLGKYL